MLERQFTEEQHRFRDAYRKFLATEIVPHMEAWREAGIVDWYNSLHSRLVGPYFSRFGSDEQQERFLPKCVTGECGPVQSNRTTTGC